VGTVISVGLTADAKVARLLGLAVATAGDTTAGRAAAVRRASADDAIALVGFALPGGLVYSPATIVPITINERTQYITHDPASIS
jgi:hypothetical protein